MENKTLEYLNTTIWYRLIKVIFIILLFFTLGIVNVLLFSSNDIKEVDANKTLIQCTLKDKKQFSAKDKNLYLNSNYFTNGHFVYKDFFISADEYNVKKIFDACYANTDVALLYDVYDEQKLVEIINSRGLIGINPKPQGATEEMNTEFQSYKDKTKNIYGTEKAEYLKFDIKMFNIIPVFSYLNFITLFILSNFVVLLIFEIIRRSFYYISLGVIRPKK